MPVGELLCETCGPFESWRDVCEMSSPMECRARGVAANASIIRPDGERLLRPLLRLSCYVERYGEYPRGNGPLKMGRKASTSGTRSMLMVPGKSSHRPPVVVLRPML